MEEMTQTPNTPAISKCHCGADADVYGTYSGNHWQVVCVNRAAHTLTRECGSRHRAVCLWNNRLLSHTPTPKPIKQVVQSILRGVKVKSKEKE